jgi:murein DD-endopeptidase MepM/ murein hydrolase activator NlpD
VQGVRPQELTDTYTDARSDGRVHDAIDIAAPKGTPVVAATDGTVLKLFQSKRGGATLYLLAYDKRTILYYAHLDKYADGLAEGQSVRKGQVVAYVGNTGNAGPNNYHLHFEVTQSDTPKRFWAGVPHNPYPLLTGKPGKSAVLPVVAASLPTKRVGPLVNPTVKPRVRPRAKVVATRPKLRPGQDLARGKVMGSVANKTRRAVTPKLLKPKSAALLRPVPAKVKPKTKTTRSTSSLSRKAASAVRSAQKGTMGHKSRN